MVKIFSAQGKEEKERYPPITGMEAKKQLQSHSFALVRVNVAPFRGRFVGQVDTRLPRFKKVAAKGRG